MNLIAIILAMLTEGFWKSFPYLNLFKVIVHLACWFQRHFGTRTWFNGPAGVLFTIAPLVILIGVLQMILGAMTGFVAWLSMLVFSMLVLVACIGVRGLNMQVDEYLHALERNDPEAAFHAIKEIIPAEKPESRQKMNLMLMETMMVRNNERLLAILFWFVVLGPVGAVIYRSTTQLKALERANYSFQIGFCEATLRLQAILDWMPARITALFYAIIGSFVDAVHHCRDHILEWRGDIYIANRGILINAGIGAIQVSELSEEENTDVLKEQILNAQDLIKRTVIAWLTVFALLTIIGWLY